MFAVGVNRKIHRSVRVALLFSGRYELRLIGLYNLMGIAGEYGIISYKKVNIQKLCKWEACRMQLLSGEKGGMTTRACRHWL